MLPHRLALTLTPSRPQPDAPQPKTPDPCVVEAPLLALLQVSVHSPTGAWPEASEFVSPPLDGGEIARRPLQGFQGFQGRTAAERAAQRAARSAE